jgi:hypothetical protein
LLHNVTLRRPPLPPLTCDVIYGSPLFGIWNKFGIWNLNKFKKLRIECSVARLKQTAYCDSNRRKIYSYINTYINEDD